MKITTAMVKELRESTGAGILEAKKALEETNGDMDGAADLLRSKGVEEAADRAHRDVAEGVIEVYSHPGARLGVILELNCETDFVARNERFQTLAHDLVLHVAAMQPLYVSPDDVPQDKLETMLEELRSEARAQGKPEDIVEKIVSGKIDKFYEESCLTEQPFVKDDDVKVKDLVTEAIRMLGENIVIRRFERYELSEQL